MALDFAIIGQRLRKARIDKDMTQENLAEKLDISVDDVDMIITKIIRSEHKSKVPEIPQKTIL